MNTLTFSPRLFFMIPAVTVARGAAPARAAAAEVI
jgi:hypothetical protein